MTNMTNMQSRFDPCLKFVLDREGGYSDCHVDHGKATNLGITQAVYNSWNALKGLPLESVQDITDADARDIYKERYWIPCRCDDLPTPLDLVVFDSAVQHGVNRAVKWLQHCVMSNADGVIGENTLFALHGFVVAKRLPEVVENYMDARKTFYRNIIKNDPTQKFFENGWANRMSELQSAIVVGTSNV